MKNEHVLLILALVLGILGGALLCKGAFDVVVRLFEGRGGIDVDSAIFFGVGVVAIVGSALLLKGSYVAGGLLNIVLGVVTVFFGRDTEGILVLVSGVLGVLAPRIKD